MMRILSIALNLAGERKEDREGAPLPFGARHLDGTAMGANDRLDDAQPEATPFVSARKFLVHLVKAPEDLLLFRRADPYAIVRDFDHEAVLHLGSSDLDCFRVPGAFQCVVD